MRNDAATVTRSTSVVLLAAACLVYGALAASVSAAGPGQPATQLGQRCAGEGVHALHLSEVSTQHGIVLRFQVGGYRAGDAVARRYGAITFSAKSAIMSRVSSTVLQANSSPDSVVAPASA